MNNGYLLPGKCGNMRPCRLINLYEEKMKSNNESINKSVEGFNVKQIVNEIGIFACYRN